MDRLCYKIWYTEENFWYTEEKYKLCYIRKALVYMDNKIWYTDENFWYTKEKYKLCYIRKAPFTWRKSDTRRKIQVLIHGGKFWYKETYKLCYIRKALLHGRQNLIHGGNIQVLLYTLGKIQGNYGGKLGQLCLHGLNKIWYTEENFDNVGYTEEKYKLCYIRKALFTWTTNLIHGGKFLIHGGKIQVMLH